MTSAGTNCGIVAIEKDAVYRKAPPRQVGLPFPCGVPCNSPLDRHARAGSMVSASRATRWLPSGSNRLRMLIGMARLHKSGKDSPEGNTVTRFLRFGVLRGLRSVEIDPEDFRRYLANKHHLWVPDFARMKDVPIERLDAIAKELIRT